MNIPFRHFRPRFFVGEMIMAGRMIYISAFGE